MKNDYSMETSAVNLQKFLENKIDEEFPSVVTKEYENQFREFKIINIDCDLRYKHYCQYEFNIHVKYKMKTGEVNVKIILTDPLYSNDTIHWNELIKLSSINCREYGPMPAINLVVPLLHKFLEEKLQETGEFNDMRSIKRFLSPMMLRYFHGHYSRISEPHLHEMMKSDLFTSVDNTFHICVYDYVNSSEFKNKMRDAKLKFMEGVVMDVVYNTMNLNLDLKDAQEILANKWVESIHNE